MNEESLNNEELSLKEDRILACRLAAQVCQGEVPSGEMLLAYIILFESYLYRGSHATAEMMNWDVVEKPPINLDEIRDNLKVILPS